MTVTTDIERTNGARSNRVALFIDVDNVLILSQNSGLPFYLSLIIDRVRQQGTIMSSKAYADWTSNLLRPFMGDFRASAIELVQLPTSASVKEHKNTADIQLAVDALEMAFSPVRPDTIVIVGGDRDYVPLVQKLKRYGVFVMGIGVESGVSKVLTEACDSFVYYDHILPPAPEIEEQIALPDPEEAYSLMVRAIEALNRDGRAPTGASVHAMMKQLAPTFDLARYKTTFKALANDAHREGYVALIELRGTDFTLTVGSGSGSRGISVPESAGREYDYSTMDAITASYRAILQDRRIPLLPWTLRETFVNLIWDRLDQRGDLGMSLDAMGVSLMDYSMDNGLRVSLQMVRKLLYTLNFAHCFSTLRNASLGYNVQVPEELDIPLYAVVDVSEAFDRLHKKYVELLANHGAMLHPDAVFALLYGDEIADEEEGARRRSDLEALCHSVRPMGPFGQALIGASRQG